MFNSETLWKERFTLFLKETSRYLRYIFNGHLVIVFMFLIGTAGFYYQGWVKTLEPGFPSAWLMALILGWAVTYSPVATFLTEADKVFLIPLEERLGDYFKRSGIFSLFLQAYLLLILLALLMPIHAQVSGEGYRSFLFFLLVLVALKALNMLIRWRVQYYIDLSVWRMDTAVRFAVNAVVLYLLFSNAGPLVLAPALLLVLLYVYYRMQTREKGLKWEQLIELEEKRMGAFYRIANLFTDVPKLKDRVKRRKWLDFLLAAKFGQNQTFDHIYRITFLRSGDYFGLFARLTIIGAVGIYLIDGAGQILLAVIFLYLTGFQLMPLWGHHENKLWTRLYPAAETSREKAFARLLSAILYVQTVIFSLLPVLKQDWTTAFMTAILGFLFAVFFTNVYSKKRRQA
jgi:ABC-2 type transport system permease protein